MKSRLLFAYLLGLLMGGSGLPQCLSAEDLVTKKLTGHWKNTPNFYQMGSNGGTSIVAASEKWIAVGTPRASEQTVHDGAVQVFNAVTGNWVRELLAPGGGKPDGAFGASCAIQGNLLVVGQKGYSVGDPGVAMLFDLLTGKLLKTFRPPLSDDVTDNGFGSAVAISGNRILVGAPRVNGRSGGVYVFDLKSGAFITKLLAAGVTGDTYFGEAIAVEGNLVAIGGHGIDSNRGAAYLYDLATLAFLRKIQPSASVAGDLVGQSLAMHHGRLVLSATNGNSSAGKLFVVTLADLSERVLTVSDAAPGDYLGFALAMDHHLVAASTPVKGALAGAVYLFDLASSSNQEFRKIVAADAQTYFGSGLALRGETLYASAPMDSTQASQAGALYVMKPIVRPTPLTKVTARGDYAPGAPDVRFNRMGDAFINPDGEIAFISTLNGPGSGGGKDMGLFSTLKAKPLMNLVAKRRGPLVGTVANVISKPLINAPGRSIFLSSLTGTGVTSGNNVGVCYDDGTTVGFQIRKGDPFGIGGSPPFQSFFQVVQTRAFDRVAIAYALKREPGGATLTSDTGMVMFGGGSSYQAKEGEFTGVGMDVYGQVAPRVSGYYDRVSYAAAIIGPPATNQAIFQMKFQTSNVEIAHKGNAATGAGGATYSAFLGESSDAFDAVLFRATLGAPATSANREGLWTRATGGSVVLTMRQADDLPGNPGVKIARFLRFWQVIGQSMALVQLKGTGVTSANDLALVLYQPGSPYNGQLAVLMREGDFAPGCEPARIGTINRVEVEPLFGHYLVLATLSGASPATNLALYRGFSFRTTATVAEQSLRRPFLVMRKGQRFENQPGRLRSVGLPTTNIASGGAGNAGLGSAMQETSGTAVAGPVILPIDFDNGVRQLMIGTP
ncbi:MAG: hypothetical protein KDN19_14010 [Verrucomicrobiae bacterium]|nr:hypothetical protein [Verrucomicrobiae bacterium]